jgi:tRNA(Ile)-lysidine synthase
VKRAAGRAAPTRPECSGEDSQLPAKGFSRSWLAAWLRSIAGPLRGQRFCLALSGGLDSSVLLDALAGVRARAGFELRAVHVDHGLHADSARWAAAARARARRLRIECAIVRVRIGPRRGESLEALARRERYAALLAQLAQGETLLTAHHLDDQLETLLLALMRGSGVRGLAAMAARSRRAGVLLLRPLLPVSRLQLERYAAVHGLGYSEDPSNAEQRFDRNYLRREVLPRLRVRWPAAAAMAARSAAHLAEAQALLDSAAGRAAAAAADGAALRVSVLRRLTPPERHNLLRYWLKQRGLPPPDQRRLREIAGPVLEARADAAPQVSWPGAELRRHGERLFAARAVAAPRRGRLSATEWNWRRKPVLRLDDDASLALIADPHGDLDLEALPCPLRVSFRRGGEKLREAHGSLPLKDLLQSRAVAPWERERVPLLRAGSRIVAVADLWLAAACRAGPHTRKRARLRWRRAPRARLGRDGN